MVASDCGAPTEIIQAGKQGAHFPAGDAKALAATVERLFSDPNHLKQISARARAHYLAHYTPQAHAEKLETVFNSIIQKSAHDQSSST